jgi:DNA polymerase
MGSLGLMPNISLSQISYEGPDRYKILCVGEAPGGEEMGQGRPFVGAAGQLVDRYLERNLVQREEVKLTNLSNYRPDDNKFEHLLDSPQLIEGLAKLKDEIEAGDPNIIIALGNWPMYFLTGMCGKEKQKLKPGTGIMTYRGSRLPTLPQWGKTRKVFCTFHPSFILRNWFWNPIFNEDIARAVEDSCYPELRYPVYEEHIDPDSDQLYDLVHEALSQEWVSLDIETFPGGRFSCVGFSIGEQKGVCVTYLRPDLHHYLQDIWESDTPKILQYGTYDISFMRHFYGWKIGGFYNGLGWDTFVASANIYPDYPRGLAFLASLYTRFPYYKEDRKIWKEAGDMSILWKYNLKDCVATYQIAMKQMGEIQTLYGG